MLPWNDIRSSASHTSAGNKYENLCRKIANFIKNGWYLWGQVNYECSHKLFKMKSNASFLFDIGITHFSGFHGISNPKCAHPQLELIYLGFSGNMYTKSNIGMGGKFVYPLTERECKGKIFVTFNVVLREAFLFRLALLKSAPKSRWLKVGDFIKSAPKSRWLNVGDFIKSATKRRWLNVGDFIKSVIKSRWLY